MKTQFSRRRPLKVTAWSYRFVERGGLFEWRVVTRRPDSKKHHASDLQRCYAIHASRTHHHISVMSPAKATETMHNRIHAGATRLRTLPSITADAPPALAHG
eukprot:4619998-Pleurochrysis_carterae.AAC.1